MPQESTVLVLGAGASVAVAKGFRPKQDRDHPPLDANFFARASRHATRAQLDPILRRAEEIGQPDLCSTTHSVSLEQYLGRLYFEMHNEPSAANIRNYYNLVRLYSAELLTTTNWLAGRKGSLSKLIRRELDAGHRLKVITFNHDLLIENALATLPQRHGFAWCISHAYSLGSQLERIAILDQPRYASDCPGHRAAHVPIYKLHGSLNWVFRTRGEHPTADFARTSAKRKLFLFDNIQIPADSRRVAGGQRGWYIWPLVVPPVYEKHGFIFGRLRSVWEAAAGALNEADRVIFWGYSFPAADLHARYFFQGAAQRNESLRAPVLINPDPSAHAALWATLRPRQVRHFQDIVDYLAAEP
jgi:hypothetical protein